jgi:nicotinic acid phosphoribosyltransferase
MSINNIDFYKADHRRQYPEGTEYVYSNFTPRSDKLFKSIKEFWDNKIVWYGLQGFVLEYLIKDWNINFFTKPKEEVVKKYKRRLDTSLVDHTITFEHIEKLHDLGYLPVQIKSLAEGNRVNIGVPVLTVTNTLPEFFWLVNYLETVMSAELWKPATVATIAYEYKKILSHYAEKTGAPLEFVPIQGHDFSFRGMSGRHDAARSGSGHLLSFVGTDTVPAIDYVEEYYGADAEEELIAGSVPATEHSVACLGIEDYLKTGGEGDGCNLEKDYLKLAAETAVIKRLITEVYPTGVVSLVSDSFDFWSVLTKAVPALKEEILNRTPNSLGLAKTIFRPDCYDDKTQILTDSGFKYFKDLKDEDLVAQVLEDGSYNFTTPIKYTEQQYDGEMIRFSDQKGKIDLLVTPNHRMIVNRNGKDHVVLAEDMPDKGYHGQYMYRSARQENCYQKLSDYERLMIAFQADGSYQTGTNKIRFSFSKQRKMERLESILSNQNISFRKYFLGGNRVEYNIDVPATDFTKDFSWVDTKNIQFEYAREFIEELSYWDATRRSDDRFKFDTINKDVIKVVELVAIAAGYGVLVSQCQDDRKEHFSDVYTAHIMRDNKTGGQSWTKAKEQYSGKVYCVQVSSGRLIVKRNRSVLVCGNSGHPVDILCGTARVVELDVKDDLFVWAEETLSEVAILNQKFARIGPGKVSCYLRQKGKTYKATGEPFWNRHDKTYYYLDEMKNIKIEEHELTAEEKGAVECLWDIFGGTETEKGYKVLHERVGLIYGDSITLERANEILKRLEAKGFASCNVVFGIGSYTYQHITRDIFGFAMKATHGVVDGEGREIFKDPATDDGTKKSAKGLLRVEKKEDNYVLYDQQSPFEEDMGELKTVFRNGMVCEDTFQTLKEIRERLK